MNKIITIFLTTVAFFIVFLTNLLSFSPRTVFATTKTSDETSYENNSKVLIDLLSIFLNIGTTENGSTTTNLSPTASPTASLTPSLSDSETTASEKYVYYAQSSSEFASYPLPSGCTIGTMGCGPTTVAMILASYIDKSITPKTIVDLYRQKGYSLGCDGSKIVDAKTTLTYYGIETTDYIPYSSATSDVVTKDFKNYLNGGYTIFALANFGGTTDHFFWITEIDDKNNIWAYDPYYGVGQTLPYNENSRYPFPKYLWAFGVKK